MPPKRTSTSAAPTITHAAIRELIADSVTAALEAQATTMTTPTITQAAIRELIADSVTAALEAQATTMTSTDNLNRNTC
nr:hypothetical protein [Tanacetum cinerariifolium]